MGSNLASHPPEITLTIAAAPAPLLDRALDWQLDWACRTVAEPAHGQPRVEFVVDAGERDPDEFWQAANARAAELCWKHRVEVLLIMEGSELRIVVERHETAGAAEPDTAVAGDGLASAPARRSGFLSRLRAVLGL
jgi:hypothetical protein